MRLMTKRLASFYTAVDQLIGSVNTKKVLLSLFLS
ncbi:hypothetical protein F444_22823 [Phytophthora nicotianae P1976]|uniref:Uncharacterized protein n=1 Tax=Phytophthora nicotianae P1976 TaxID=1317066 RepID=A0A080YWN2_PHYNI|nr:hypothetical protein F444_22823 [Phytophthora nicotianae P1976]